MTSPSLSTPWGGGGQGPGTPHIIIALCQAPAGCQAALRTLDSSLRSSSQSPCAVGTLTIPILQMKKLRFGETGLRNCPVAELDLNSGRSAQESARTCVSAHSGELAKKLATGRERSRCQRRERRLIPSRPSSVNVQRVMHPLLGSARPNSSHVPVKSKFRISSGKDEMVDEAVAQARTTDCC